MYRREGWQTNFLDLILSTSLRPGTNLCVAPVAVTVLLSTTVPVWSVGNARESRRPWLKSTICCRSRSHCHHTIAQARRSNILQRQPPQTMGLPNRLMYHFNACTHCNVTVKLDKTVYTLVDTDRREVLDLIHMYGSIICDTL